MHLNAKLNRKWVDLPSVTSILKQKLLLNTISFYNLRQNYSKQSMSKHNSLHFPLAPKYPSSDNFVDSSACLINNQKRN